MSDTETSAITFDDDVANVFIHGNHTKCKYGIWPDGTQWVWLEEPAPKDVIFVIFWPGIHEVLYRGDGVRRYFQHMH